MVGHRISRSHAGVNLRAAERDGRRLRGVLPVYHYQKNITVEDYASSHATSGYTQRSKAVIKKEKQHGHYSTVNMIQHKCTSNKVHLHRQDQQPTERCIDH
uniref:Uncharacterized protein n=2 Tax=Oryza sativa subsp. japonica TaxID=39947 RepID=Q53MZ0_ORYSJ|nr:hypothetical protein [Oryza sativa Japonica Group]ABA92893.1 hypothetical protein LOC_Os11g20490 [Oryza sativa Japonica Group]